MCGQREIVPGVNGTKAYGEDMFRLLSVGVILLVVASTGVAGEHYVEIWNPPEARQVKPPVSGKPKPGKASVLSRRTPKVTPRRVADPVAKSLPGARAATSPAKPVTPQPTSIPRIMTPEGNVLRVNNGGAPVEVVR